MVLAHLGGLPLEESLVYLVPPVAVVATIFVLGRRGPRPPEEEEEDPAVRPPVAAPGHEGP